MTLIDYAIQGLINGFSFMFALAFNEWLFKKRIEKALDKFEKKLKEAVKNVRPV